MPAAVGVSRGCGSRIENGVYSECGFSEYGRPWQHFLVDPPKPVELHAWGVSDIGVTERAIGGTTHVVDKIGSEHYPNVADFLEEFRRYGMSRRIPKTFDFSRLTLGSTQILLHSRAYIENFPAYYWGASPVCPKDLRAHGVTVPETMCAGLWWEDVTGGVTIEDGGNPLAVARTIPACTYHARRAPEGVAPAYLPAIFAIFPITNISVIRARDGSHNQTWERVERMTELPVLVQDA